MGKFIGVDGESYSDGDDHRYILLANSYGQHLYNGDGISTVEALEFLLAMPKAKGRVFVGFGFNYDVNMMLRDIPSDQLLMLKENKLITWGDYRIEWIPNKWFHVSKDGKNIRIHEVFGFFQSSFVKALEQWDITPPDDLEAMKKQRSDFTEAMKDEIIAYCINECNLLTQLMARLNDALKAVDLRPSNWIGAGSIAAALLRQHKIGKHHVYDVTLGDAFHLASLTAYFGGRVELFKQGYFPKLWDYDIISAYPFASTDLPSFQNAEVTEVAGYEPNQYGMYLVSWDIPEGILMPFPVRKQGQIYYPRNGRGWYHYPEIEQALKAYRKYITVEQSIILKPTSIEKPFEFIPKVFAHRAKLKAEGHPAQKALKLGLNSLYGKLAQGIGYRDKLPPFQSYYWAGYITSITRARAFNLAISNPDALVMIATDGIFFDRNVKIPTSTGLGGLELALLTDCFVAQPGVYSATDEDGTEFAKSRGFFAKEIDFNSLREGYEDESYHHVAEYESTRFIGLLYALHSGHMHDWRTWKTSTRKLSLYPNRKFPDGHNPTIHLPPTIDVQCSQPYTPKGGSAVFPSDIDPAEYIQGLEQPLRSY